MADEYGVPQPNCAEDYERFIHMLGALGCDAVELRADPEGMRLLREALEAFEREFEQRFGSHP